MSPAAPPRPPARTARPRPLRRRGALLVGLALAVGAACAPRSTPIVPLEALAYRFHLAHPVSGGERRVEIELETRGSDEGRTSFVVQPHWGGVEAGGADLFDVCVRGLEGVERVVENPEPHRWTVEHHPGELLLVTWELRENANQDDRSPRVHYRPILNPGLFHMIGELGLLLPGHLDPREPLDVSLVWSGFEEAGWSVVNSFGRGSSVQHLRVALEDLRHGLYLAGPLQLIEGEVRGRPVLVTVAGREWRFEPGEFGRLAHDVVAAQREFFDDFDLPWYLVSLIPVGRAGERGQSMGGTGLTNGFALFLLPDASLDSSVQRLLAHEMFHHWNGRVIGREDPEQLVYWFSEGFTDFYARRLLYRAGEYDLEEYARDLDRKLADYARNAERSAPNARILEAFWDEPAIQSLPYQRGDLVAMLADRAIREHSGGLRSLDDLMRRLVHEGRAGQRVTTELLLERLAEEAGEEAAAALRAIVVDGAPAQLAPDHFAPCLVGAPAESSVFDLGFDLEASQQASRVLSVQPDSAAWQAGLRDGQDLVGWSVWQGDPERQVELRVVEGGRARTVKYLPRGESVLRQRFEPAPDAPAACPGL